MPVVVQYRGMAGHHTRRSSSGGGAPTSVDVDAALRLLANPQCRFVLRRLAAAPTNTANVDDLLESYAEHAGVPRETVEIDCRHAHLPLLVSAGVVTFDEATGDLRYHPDPMLESLLSSVDRWEA